MEMATGYDLVYLAIKESYKQSITLSKRLEWVLWTLSISNSHTIIQHASRNNIGKGWTYVWVL